MPSSFSQSPIYARIFLVVLFLWTCAVLFPAFPNVIGLGLDPSWEHGLNLAHAQHLTFGTDIAFTYGPLAYLAYPAARTVSSTSVVLWNFSIYAISIYFIVKLIKLRQPISVIAVIFIPASSLAAFRLGFGFADRSQMAFLLASWFLIVECSFKNMLAFILAGILAGISLLIKVNDGVINIAVFYAIWACSVWRVRTINWRAIVAGILPLAAFCIVFRIVNGPLSAIFNYLHTSVLIGGGYSEAMSVIGPAWQVALAATAIVVLFLILLTKTRDIPYRILIPLLLLSWSAFKHCMVRQDGHAIPFHAELAAVAGFGLLTATSRVRRNLLLAFTVANLCGGLLIAYSETPYLFNNIVSFLQVSFLPGDIDRYLHLDESWQILEFNTDAALAEKRADPAVVKLVGKGTVDDLTWNVDYIAANHFRWNPRPVFQSYAAYEPALDSMNATHLDRAGADFLSLKFEEIDGRHPFLDDVSTWREVFNHYNIGGGGLELMLLSRRSQHRYSKPQPVTGTSQAHWGQQIRIPSVADNQVVVMKAAVGRSLWGILRESVFRLDPAYLDVTYKSGLKAEYRITRPNLVNGAIVSDLPQSLAEMLPLFGYDINRRRDRVAAIRWVSPSQEEFDNPIDLSWSVMTLKLANTNDRPPLFHPDTSSFISLWKPGDGVAVTSALEAQKQGDEVMLRPTSDDPQVLLKTSQDMARFNSILIRARFSVSDQINVFFGQQANGRGFGGFVPIAGQWLDIFLKVDRNPFWKKEAGNVLRFDPVTGLFRNSHIELAGVWGSTQSFADKPGEMSTYLSQADGELAK